MKRNQMRAKLAKIILKLNEIICSETEQTHGLASVKKCHNDLQKVLIQLNAKGKAVDLNAVLVRIYRLIDCAYFFIFGKDR